MAGIFRGEIVANLGKNEKAVLPFPLVNFFSMYLDNAHKIPFRFAALEFPEY